MKRTITATAKSDRMDVKSCSITVKIETQYITADGIKKEVSALQNKLHEFLRSQGYNHAEIKIS